MIECYFSQCPNHEVNHLPEDRINGPFCNNDVCTAASADMQRWAEERRRDLYKKGVKNAETNQED